MHTEHSKFELWRVCDWRCEWWTVGGQSEVRLYFDGHLVGELADGPQLDLRRQTQEWLLAARADIECRLRPPTHAQAVPVRIR